MERKKIAPGVYITTLDAEKFNRCRITIHLRFPAKRESATDAAVLPLVLERGYAGCPDMTALSRKLARLYGADLGVDISSAGVDRVLTVDICGIKDRFALMDENLTEEYAAIVFGIIFEPYLVDRLFDSEAVRIEKEALALRLDAEFNNKRLYCVRQARRKFYGSSPAGIELGGYRSDLPNVTPASLKAEYDRILSLSSIDVMVQGADAVRVEELLLEKLENVSRSPRPFAPAMAMPVIEPQHFVEEIPGLTQAKLCMLFTRGTAEDLPSISVMRMAMSLFGGSTTSRLFRNVREKQSLCYYCGASALRATGVMMVDSGVEPGGEERAEQAILKELEALRTGPITAEEMEDCRRSLLSSMDSLGDSLGGLESWYYGQILRDEPLAPPEYGKVLTQAVTVDEVREVLQSYHYSVCYALTADGKGAQA
ncbi:MAG: insulinase family protein [Oscillospiraceae bacterium]|nr:insulinase family protein [Oscillospiraceae bacterium]